MRPIAPRRVEIHDGDAAWPLVEPLDKAVYSDEVMADIVWRDVVWAHATSRVLAWDNDGRAPVSHVGVFRRQGANNGRSVQIGGVGGVMTLPTARGCGFASAAMRTAHALMRDSWACDFAVLFSEAHNYPLYASLGWRIYAGDVLADQVGVREPFFMTAMVLDLNGKAEDGTIDLFGLPW